MNFVSKLLGLARKSNPALDAIRSNYSDRSCTSSLIRVLPSLATNLYTTAKRSAKNISDPHMEQRRKNLLADCIFDLELFAGFDEVVAFSGDAALASLYIDALLTGATGQMPCTEVTEIEYREEGTQMCRGIAKYSAAKEYFRTGDPHGWLFGKEYSAIMSGSPSDIAYIGAVLPASIGLRAEGRWRTRYALTGQVPTGDEQEALAAIIKKFQAELLKSVSG